MLYKCENCGDRIKYDIEKQLMRCESCGRLAETVEMVDGDISFDQYHCADCGAVLAVNAGEITSTCPYCGAQSLLFDHKLYNFNPDYILPFRVTKRIAYEIAKEEFKRFKFSPKKIREFEEGKLKPLYVPFRLHNIKMHTSQHIMVKVEEESYIKKKSTIVYYKDTYRNIDVKYENVDFDVSKNLPDCLSLLLGPWNKNNLKPFNPMYISGLYCGVDDVDKEEAAMGAVERAKGFIDNRVLKSFTHPVGRIAEKDKGYEYSVESQTLALLPIWFFSAEYKGNKYVAIINGENGKIISAVPVYRGYIFLLGIGITAFIYGPMMLLVSVLSNPWFYAFFQEFAVAFLIVIFLTFGGIFTSGLNKYKNYKRNLKAAWSSSIIKMAESEK